MVEMLKIVFIVSVLICLIISSSFADQQACSKYSFSDNRRFASCIDLPVLDSFIHYNYESSSGNLDVAFRKTGISTPTWIAWAINPAATGMVGSQALVAYQKADGKMKAYTSPITSYKTSLEEGKLSFGVSDLTATFAKNEMTIFATLTLGEGNTTVNQVWQEGPLSDDAPEMHSTSGGNVQSMGKLNLLSGTASSSGAGNSKSTGRNIHGILNAVSWGIMMPTGAILARYLKVFKSSIGPLWFNLHVGCQASAYVIGVAGVGTGLKLGAESPGVEYSTHRKIGITLLCLGTLQAFALLLRPKPDHKYRIFWNFYHHSCGYTAIILGVVNIYKGFQILQPGGPWKQAYTGIIIALAATAVVLEVFTLFIVIKRKREENSDKI
ncbi:cytochrome b561 and DOMON domain-containing protein At5g47530-like [Mangifera indica]|uniref:cytochrome b561 and DOMON domain-containing protein At5g47530-like n=1 Tax=Mangifera indica TaxID=29780 RepID=UPI001CF9B147|nr:cytochrome b561 and DOMON domain-containing protein At5g47530-like [Mangifera indica]